MKRSQTYSQDFKEKLIKEYQETGSLSVVAKNHSVPVTTLRQLIFL
jgi:transposase-like protein